MFDGIDGYEATMDRLVVEEIHDALEYGVPHDDVHASPFDADHHVFPLHDPEHGDAHGGAAHPLTIGSPDGDGFTPQTTVFTCAVVSQKMILDAFRMVSDRTGKPFSERELQYEAEAHGWLSDHGTSLADVGKLIDYHGIDCHHGSGWPELLHDLAGGHQAIVALNANGLWTSLPQLSPLMHIFGQNPNHALVLRGLRVDEQGHVMVIVNDPGRTDGAGNEYPLSQFQNALHNSSFHFVATDNAPPDWSPPPALPSLEGFQSHVGTASEATWCCPVTPPYASLLNVMDDDHKHDLMRLL